MKIVIEMPQERYERLDYVDSLTLKEIIKNGTVLPEQHGDLINRDENDNKQIKDESIKQTIEGFTQFMRGLFNNPNLSIPEDLAEKYNISSEYRKIDTERSE